MATETDIEHFRNLVSLSAADGKIAEAERVALSKIAFERSIPLDRVNVMINKANEYKYLIPQNTKDREKQLTDMISFAKVDGDFAKAEFDLIRIVANRLEFTKSELQGFIDKAQ